jgi:hypothetical protein
VGIVIGTFTPECKRHEAAWLARARTCLSQRIDQVSEPVRAARVPEYTATTVLLDGTALVPVGENSKRKTA